MAIVNEQVTEEQAKNLMQMLLAVINSGADIAKALASKQEIKDIDNTAEMFAEAIKNGEKTSFQTIETKDSLALEALMRQNRVAFMKTGTYQDKVDGTYRTCYMTLERDDAKMIGIWNQIKEEKSIGKGEKEARDFANDAYKKDVVYFKNLDASELELFRVKMKDFSGAFSVLNNEKDKSKYDIVCLSTDENNIKKALLEVNYDFAGLSGQEYKNNLDKDIANKKRFLDKVYGNLDKGLFIVDKDPNKFIRIEKDTYSIHQIKQVEVKAKDGSMKKQYRDFVLATGSMKNKNEFLSLVQTYNHPALLTRDKMANIADFDVKGNAIPSANYNSVYLQMKDIVKNAQVTLPAFKLRTLERKEKVDGLKDLDQEQIALFMKTIKDHNVQSKFIVLNDSIAWDKSDAKLAAKMLEESIYKDMTPIEKLETKLYHQGRGNISFKNLEEPQYIVSADRPDYVIKVNNKALEIIKDGKPINMVPNENRAEFEDLIYKTIHQMKEPVILTEREIHSKERLEIIKSATEEFNKNEAIDYMKEIGKNQLKDLEKAIDDPSQAPNNLSDRQKEALTKVHVLEIERTRIDRTLAEKIIDRDFGDKIREEYTAKEVQKDRFETRDI